MIPITIGDKKYRIKAIKDLSTKEFIEVSGMDSIDLLKYIKWASGAKLEDVFFASISEQLRSAIGSFKAIADLPIPYKYSKCSIDTVGQRNQIEACHKTGYDLVVFTLAVAICRDNNIDVVNKKVEQLMGEPYVEVIPAGVFFLNLLRNGKSSERNFLKRSLLYLKTKATEMLRGLKR